MLYETTYMYMYAYTYSFAMEMKEAWCVLGRFHVPEPSVSTAERIKHIRVYSTILNSVYRFCKTIQ